MTSNEIKKKGRWATKRAKKKKKQSQKVDSYRKTARLRLQKMLEEGFGTKRSSDKEKANTKNKIYSKRTFITYKNQFRYFADWLEVAHPEAKSIEDAFGFVDEYLQHLIDLDRSAYSISTAKAALAKVFGVEATQFIATPSRTRANVSRSRGEAKRDKHISKKKEEALARFTSATGLRRAEMERIEAEDLVFENGKPMLIVDKGTKGGKNRKAEIIGQTEGETRQIVEWIQSRKGRLFSKLPSHYDNHYYRAFYANRAYKKYARNVDKIPRREKYVMRKDRAGETYDRVAMEIVSGYLGHNRTTVVAQSYLYQE